MKISVLTPSIRPTMLKDVQESLERQTFKDFEWLVEIGMHGQGFTLSEDMNKMLRRAKGDIIISLQDAIKIPPEALEQIAALDHTKTAYTYPVGKLKLKEGYFVHPLLGREIDPEPEWDWRKTRAEALGKDDITPNMWETDFASAPREMFFSIGGYDEKFKKGWSFDNVEVAWRSEAAGYRFKSSVVTAGLALDHDAVMEHPHRKTLPLNDHRANEAMEKARRGNFKLSYL